MWNSVYLTLGEKTPASFFTQRPFFNPGMNQRGVEPWLGLAGLADLCLQAVI